ncbi:MAG: hypothetical protein A3I77_08790 [Gammaproteobacteria bacterium RIFCSPLOWO2_02_FULL_42_14]|nr:MAG: hypothetical protein A3B71_00190 [Gammaproteobacteria bacterium RIFCSPHIGHO2_02_FULL_42_43]OGT50958.1 MAG: hypothetical protein A3E54_00020 [Gammaproteobacteria bacterium RIFCSPHIGHO2_12_FULL_41_25]OGT63068.1 MAG: hypothetical protein A3I77_08790 [Gammaproteobacteria bacterium RIFCSPLOWO2_02_FULL_42_14]OGT85639.1 MAG: hypothetical protein A3G86_00020 [Gammaproteobacteria bacterium RIFCSPLOWO2_12_FULL_42_18]
MEPAPKPQFPRSAGIPVIIFLFVLLLGGCFHRSIQDGAPRYHVDVSKIHSPTPHYLPKSKYGNPSSYFVDGVRYRVLHSANNYRRRGIASWYGTKFQGRLTSTREPYDLLGMTAASPELPIPCFVRVTNLENGKQIIVKVNDRGPFAPNRILDLSFAAAKKLGYANRGTALVEVDSIDVRNPAQPRQYYATHKPKIYLQVGAFSRSQNALRLRNEIERVTHREARITQEHNRYGLYRVQVGPLRSVDESDTLQQRIQRLRLGRAITVIG